MSKLRVGEREPLCVSLLEISFESLELEPASYEIDCVCSEIDAGGAGPARTNRMKSDPTPTPISRTSFPRADAKSA